VNELGFQRAEEALLGALSQQFPLRLIDWTIAAACRMSR
jgi:hypothetical protein